MYMGRTRRVSVRWEVYVRDSVLRVGYIYGLARRGSLAFDAGIQLQMFPRS